MTPPSLPRGLRCAIPFLALCSAAIAANPKPQPLPKCFVWRVTNAKAPFYLVGSIHALNAKDYPLPTPYDIALKDAQRFLFEFNLNQEDEFGRKFSAAGKYPAGQDLRTKIHPPTLAWLRKNTEEIDWSYSKSDKKFHATARSFDNSLQYRPWWIAHHYFDIHGYTDITDERGVDNYMAVRARKAGKQIAGLESVDEHIAVLSGLSDMDSEIVLLDTLVYSSQAATQFNRVRSAWRRGDTAAMWDSDARLRKEAFWIAGRLVDQRNIRWIPRIVAEIKTGKPTAIVAGAMHFSGPNSVVTLLQKRGYTVEQL